MSKNSKDTLKSMCNFFCKLHLLANSATESDKILKIREDVAFDQKPRPGHEFSTNESGGVRLIRTTGLAPSRIR